MASSRRSWTALPLFHRIQTDGSSVPRTTNQIINRENYFKENLMPLSQMQTDINSSIGGQVPDLPYSAKSNEPQDALVSRHLPFPTTSSSTTWFGPHNTPASPDDPFSNPVLKSTQQHKTQKPRAEYLDLGVQDETLSFGPSRERLSKTSSSDHQPAVNAVNALEEYGIPLHKSAVAVTKAWCCGFPGCNSQVVFTRACDLQKHYKRHSQRFYCRKPSCARSAEADTETKVSPTGTLGHSNSAQHAQVSSGPGRVRHRWFASKKDRDRHEAKHSPRIQCTWRGSNGEHCSRLFSRLDNMKDHIRRVHKPTIDSRVET